MIRIKTQSYETKNNFGGNIIQSKFCTLGPPKMYLELGSISAVLPFFNDLTSLKLHFFLW